jgi:hypothetical protein
MTECAEVTIRHFGERYPTLGRMLNNNPRAMLEHFWWNLSLTPNGLQVMLFNATSGHVTPDYFPVRAESRLALVGSLLLAAVVLAGLRELYRDRQRWWRSWVRARAWLWVFVLGTTLPHASIVILTQRPRPAYLFDLSVCLMAVVGTCGWALWRQVMGTLPFRVNMWARRRSAVLALCPMLLLIVVAPRHYASAPDAQRPLLQAYRRLAPFAELIARDDVVMLVSRYPGELAYYVGLNLPRVLDYAQGLPDWGANIEAFLDERGVNLFYVDETLISRLPWPSLFVDRLQATREAGWDLLALGDDPHV